MKTPIGRINIFINGQMFDFSPRDLPNKAKNFEVDKRYQIILDLAPFENENIIIECVLKANANFDFKSVCETGEALALISFYHSNTKLSIGFEGDISNVSYEYLVDRIRIKIPQHALLKQILCNIAWLTMHDIEKEDTFTWFAADPTLIL